MIYRDANGDTITLHQRANGSQLWEMRRDGVWFGAADYLSNLGRMLTKHGYRRIA